MDEQQDGTGGCVLSSPGTESPLSAGLLVHVCVGGELSDALDGGPGASLIPR